MSNVILRGIVAVPAVAVFAALGPVVLGGTGIAAASSPSSAITVQDDGSDGAAVRTGSEGNTDSDGTQGDFKQATDGTTTGPLEDAVPQYKAK